MPCNLFPKNNKNPLSTFHSSFQKPLNSVLLNQVLCMSLKPQDITLLSLQMAVTTQLCLQLLGQGLLYGGSAIISERGSRAPLPDCSRTKVWGFLWLITDETAHKRSTATFSNMDWVSCFLLLPLLNFSHINLSPVLISESKGRSTSPISVLIQHQVARESTEFLSTCSPCPISCSSNQGMDDSGSRWNRGGIDLTTVVPITPIMSSRAPSSWLHVHCQSCRR